MELSKNLRSVRINSYNKSFFALYTTTILPLNSMKPYKRKKNCRYYLSKLLNFLIAPLWLSDSILPLGSMKPYKCKKIRPNYLTERFSNSSIAPLWLSDSIQPLGSMKPYKCKKIVVTIYPNASQLLHCRYQTLYYHLIH